MARNKILNMHPSFILEIDNRCFSGQHLVEAIEKDHLDLHVSWQNSIVKFLKQWLNDDEVMLVHTSGSTGNPQVIRLLKSQMRISASLTCDYFDLQPADRALLCLSVENIAGKMMMVRAMERGLHLIAVLPAGCPLSNISEKVKFAAMVPLQVQRCLKEKCLDRTEKLLIGGAAVSDKMLQELMEQAVACYCSYGMTETMSHVALKKLNGKNASEWFEGLADIRFSLDDRGCLTIDTGRLGIGKLQTNDLCELDGKNKFRWLGRIDFVINSGGVKVIPEKLEKLLSPILHFPFFISGIPDEEFGEKVVLLIEAPTAKDIPVDQLIGLFQAWPKYERPKNIFYIPAFSYTHSGKLNRGASLSCERYPVL